VQCVVNDSHRPQIVIVSDVSLPSDPAKRPLEPSRYVGCRRIRCFHKVRLKIIHVQGLLTSLPLKLIGPQLDRYPRLTNFFVFQILRFPNVYMRLSKALAVTRGSDYQVGMQVDRSEVYFESPKLRDFLWGNSLCEKNQNIDSIMFYTDQTIRSATNTGIQRVVRQLARSIQDSAVGITFVKWNRKNRECEPLSHDDMLKLNRWNGPSVSKNQILNEPKRPTLLVVPEIPYAGGLSAPSAFELCRWAKQNRMQIAFVFYDMIPLRFNYSAAFRRQHIIYSRELIEADYIWTISAWVKDDLLAFWKFLGFESTKIPSVSVQALGFEPVGLQVPTSAIDFDRIILSVGTIEERKNQITLIKSFIDFLKLPNNQDWMLHLVGNLDPKFRKQLTRYVNEYPNIKYRGMLSDEELVHEYVNCAFTVFPSFEEGFGLPITESLSYGKPCVASNYGAVAEIALDGGCIAIDMRDGKKLTFAMNQIANDESLRNRLIDEAKQLQKKTWGQYAQNVLESPSTSSRSDVQVIYVLFDSDFENVNSITQCDFFHSFAAGLSSHSCRVIPALWNRSEKRFTGFSFSKTEPSNDDDQLPASVWSGWLDPAFAPPDSWVIDMTNHFEARSDLIASTKHLKLKLATALNDESVFTKEDLDSLADYELIFPNSTRSANQIGEYFRTLGYTYNHIENSIIPIVKPITTPSFLRALIPPLSDPEKWLTKMLQAFELSFDYFGSDLHVLLVGNYTNPAVTKTIENYLKKYTQIKWIDNVNDPLFDYLQHDQIGKRRVFFKFTANDYDFPYSDHVIVDMEEPVEIAGEIIKTCVDLRSKSQLLNQRNSEFSTSWHQYGQEIRASMDNHLPFARLGSFGIEAASISQRCLEMGLCE
jgi:glycosyltransferase involved in cell wall biosynthesis